MPPARGPLAPAAQPGEPEHLAEDQAAQLQLPVVDRHALASLASSLLTGPTRADSRDGGVPILCPKGSIALPLYPAKPAIQTNERIFPPGGPT